MSVCSLLYCLQEALAVLQGVKSYKYSNDGLQIKYKFNPLSFTKVLFTVL